MKFARLLTLTAALCLLMGPTAGLHNAAAADAGAAATAIQQRYEKLSAFEAGFEQTLSHKESGVVEKRSGTLQFKKPLLIKWQTVKPQPEMLVVTRQDIWEFLPEEEVAYRYSRSLVQNSASIIQIITGQAALTRDFEVKVMGRENGMEKLQLFPLEPSTQLVEATLWVDDKQYIRRVRIVDFYGNTNEIHFTSFTANASLKDRDFQFTPPKGVEVEDRTGQDGQPRIFQ